MHTNLFLVHKKKYFSLQINTQKEKLSSKKRQTQGITLGQTCWKIQNVKFMNWMSSFCIIIHHSYNIYSGVQRSNATYVFFSII